MKRIFTLLTVVGIVAFGFTQYFKTQAQKETNELVSPNIVISQFQVAGGTANDEFIELHNTSANPVDLNGYRVVYRSANGTNDVLFAEWTTSTVIPAGGFYLIASTAFDGGVTPNLTYNPTTCMCSMSATSGGIAVRLGALNTGTIIDSVGYGSATNAFIETTVTTAPAANNGQGRLNNGCQDTDNNSADFSTLIPAAPRNAATTPNVCSGVGTTIFASGSALPNSVNAGGLVLFRVSVIPATTPPSTNISVSANLTAVGGSATQQFFDDGTNGDATAGDNIFSYLYTIPTNASSGSLSLLATASDAQSRSTNTNINLTIIGATPTDDPLVLGNPSNATTNVANENNYLMQKPQYSLSYNRSKATPNWTAWRLDSSWIGTTPRQDDFRPDTSLPVGWYQVTDSDYSGSGYDRGHMCPSGDRTNTIPNNSATFLMTNMIPQLAANNQGPWEEFESYCRTLVGQGNEIYIFSGGHGNIGTIANGRVVVPQMTWKVALVLPNGTNDLERITKQTRVIAIIVPNQPPLNINAPWRNFRTRVDTIEALTGFDFFSNVPRRVQTIIEKRKDWE